MTQLRTTLLGLALFSALTALAGAAAPMINPATSIRPWLGTWSCKASGNNHTATFRPLFGGNAMRISETGSVPSEELIGFDKKQQRWIDQYRDSSGAYMTFVGTPSGKNINFVQAYPSGDAAIRVMSTSKNTYASVFTATMNGKKMVERESCTRM